MFLYSSELNYNTKIKELKMITSEEYKGCTIEIHNDENYGSPREWDNICEIHVAHRNYAFGDYNYNNLESITEAEKERKNNGDIILPLYMYDHSGITISLSPFSCQWDSMRVGFVSIPKNKIVAEFGKKIFTKKLKVKAFELAIAEVKDLDMYLRGEVVGYIVKGKDEEIIDSCWGYYDKDYCIKEAKSVIDCNLTDKKKKHFEYVKEMVKNKVPFQYRESFQEAITL